MNFYMPIEDIFEISGRGIVVTGTILSGSIEVNEQIEIVSSETKSARVTGIERLKKLLDRAEEGDNVGILLCGITKKDVRRGAVLASPGLISSHQEVEADIYFFTHDEGGRKTAVHSNYRPQLKIYQQEFTCEIILPEEVGCAFPGDFINNVYVKLFTPCPLIDGQSFLLKESGRVVAKGEITNLLD